MPQGIYICPQCRAVEVAFGTITMNQCCCACDTQMAQYPVATFDDLVAMVAAEINQNDLVFSIVSVHTTDWSCQARKPD